jgi:hypothetical protein
VEFPLPWERVVWVGRSVLVPSHWYGLSDLRLVHACRGRLDELTLYDIDDIRVARSRMQRLTGLWTVVIQARDSRRAPIRLTHVRRGPQLAAALELLATHHVDPIDVDVIRSTLAWKPAEPPSRGRELVAGAVAVACILLLVAIGLQGRTPSPVAYAADDAIRPGGVKREAAEIVAVMETAVMPWAKRVLAPLVGGPDNVTCETCHGAQGAARGWDMPAVVALPQPLFRDLGWEINSGRMDPQMRNAIYGYVAESDKQSKAKYMRDVVMPGMAQLLRRPAYDFTRTYEFNRSRQAFGCYHCHQVN